MQGEPIQFLAESHCAVRSSKDSSLSKDQGGASGIAGKSRVAKGPDAGITDRPERGLVRVVTRLRRSITFSLWSAKRSLSAFPGARADQLALELGETPFDRPQFPPDD
jgi:hypothetical protein